MDSNIIIIFFFISIWSTHVHCQSNIFTVDESGAISYQQTDNKQAFTDAWKKACSTNGGTMSVPAGSNYLLSDVEFAGPCSGQTKFVIDGNITATDVPSPNIDYWIIFHNVDSLTISGKGTLDGRGASYWSKTNDKTITSLKLGSSKNVVIQDINSVNSKKFHMNLNGCQNVSINNVHITAPESSINTDGIHVSDSDNVRISNTNIATGDDCISLGDGSTNINITGVTCGPGHGISIGSLGKYAGEKDVRSVTVTNCTLSSTTNGVRIKSWAPSLASNVVSMITFQGIIINNVKNPIIIDQYYCPNSNCAGNGESSVSVKGVKFIDVHGSSSTEVGVNIACSKITPCQDIELSGVKLTYNGQPTTASCSSANINFNGTNQVPSSCMQTKTFM